MTVRKVYHHPDNPNVDLYAELYYRASDDKSFIESPTDHKEVDFVGYAFTPTTKYREFTHHVANGLLIDIPLHEVLLWCFRLVYLKPLMHKHVQPLIDQYNEILRH